MCARTNSPIPTSSTEPALRLLHRDAHCVVVDKPCGVPSQPDPSGDASVLDLLLAGHGLHGLPVHRLDRPVSGCLLVALDREGAARYSASFAQRKVRKTYWAVVEGEALAEARLQDTLHRDARGHRARVAKGGGGQQLHYLRLAQGDRLALLEVVIVGGAFHQVRAQLAASGLPVRGDVKYGARRGNRDRSIALHARSLAWTEPFTGMEVQVEASTPDAPWWRALFNIAGIGPVQGT